MKYHLLKRAGAFLLTGALILGGGVQLPEVTAEAATDLSTIRWIWNDAESSDGYEKVPYGELTAEADSQQTSGEDASAGKRAGYARNVVDGDTATYWHTAYANDSSLIQNANGRLTSGNKLVITLAHPTDVAGVTILSRQDEPGNGVIQMFDVEVQRAGEDTWRQVDYTGETWRHGTDFTRGAWADGMAKAEREFHFTEECDNVKKVRLTIKKTSGYNTYDTDTNDNVTNPFINAAEIGILRKKQIEAPKFSTQQPDAEANVSEVTVMPEMAVQYGDTADNPANISGDYWVTHEKNADGVLEDIFKGKITVEDVEKLRISHTRGAAITFQYRCGHIVNGQSILGKGSGEYAIDFNAQGFSFYARTTAKGSGWHWPQTSWNLNYNANGNNMLGIYDRENQADNVFAGRWHDIAVCYTAEGYRIFVDGQLGEYHRPTSAHGDEVIVLDSDHAGSLVINNGNRADACYKNFKIYSDVSLGTLGTNPSSETVWNALKTALAVREPVFALGRVKNEETAAPDYNISDTTWTNEAGEEVTAFAAEPEAYTATVTLTAKDDKTKFTDASKPKTIQVNVPDEETPMEVKLADGDVTVAEDGSTMTITHTFEPVTMHVAVADGCGRMGTVSAGNYDSEATENREASYDTYYKGKVKIIGSPRAGYAFEGWYTDAAGTVPYDLDLDPRATHKIDDLRETQTLYAKFVPKAAHSRFRVTVSKQIADKTYVTTGHYWQGSYNDAENVVDLSEVPDAALDIPTGKVFSHWAESKNLNREETKNIVFSANRNLRFRIPGDLELVPVFKDEGSSQTETAYAEVSDTYLIRNENDLGANASVRFVGKLHIPEGWTLNETGLLWTGKAETGTADEAFRINENDGSMKLNVHQIVAPTINVSYQFSGTVSGVPVGKTLYGRIYAKVTHDGTTEWIYSYIVPVTHTDIRTIPAAE